MHHCAVCIGDCVAALLATAFFQRLEDGAGRTPDRRCIRVIGIELLRLTEYPDARRDVVRIEPVGPVLVAAHRTSLVGPVSAGSVQLPGRTICCTAHWLPSGSAKYTNRPQGRSWTSPTS